MIYLVLFALGFANEASLTSYYTQAALGRRWRCVGLALFQQLVSMSALCLNIVDVEPMSREMFLRWTVTAVSYGCATAWVVRPPKP